MHPTSQRIDIAEVVNEFLEEAEESEAMFESVRRPRRPLRARRAAPIDPVDARGTRSLDEAEAWYVVIDEIVEDTVTFEAWPWPTIDPATRFLSFDLDKGLRKTVGRNDLQAIVNERRAERDRSATTDRPLRIGDVFEVAAARIRNPKTWVTVTDDTRRKRREAKAALHAMAAPPHFTSSDTLEAIGKEIEDSSQAEMSGSSQAFPAV